METIGQRIAKLRDIRAEECGHCTQQDLADAMDVGKGTIYKWENDLVSLNAEKIVALSEFFDVSCDYLLRGGSSDHLKMMDATGLSNETIAVLSYWRTRGKFVSEMIDILVMNYPFLIVLHDYLFGDFPEAPEPKHPFDYYSNLELHSKLAVIDAIEKMRREIQDGKH